MAVDNNTVLETPKMDAQLLDKDGTAYEIAGEQTLGRSSSSDITIGNEKISRDHAILRFKDGRLTVEDQNSKNGTSVNFKKLRANEETELYDGDTVSFHTIDMSVVISGLPDNDVNDERDDSGKAQHQTRGPEFDSGAPQDSVGVDAEQERSRPVDAAEDGSLEEKGGASVLRPGEVIAARPAERTREKLVHYLKRKQESRKTKVITLKDKELKTLAGQDVDIHVPERSDGPHLIVLFPSGRESTVTLDYDASENPHIWEVGRHEDCQIVLRNPDAPGENVVSRFHIQLVLDDGRWCVISLVPTNPTFVNGSVVNLYKYISDDDKIRIANFVVVFKSGHKAEIFPPGPRPGPDSPDSRKACYRLVRWGGIICLGLAATAAFVAWLW